MLVRIGWYAHGQDISLDQFFILYTAIAVLQYTSSTASLCKGTPADHQNGVGALPLAPQQVAQIRHNLPATLPHRPHVLHALPAVLLQEALHTCGCTKELLALAHLVIQEAVVRALLALAERRRRRVAIRKLHWPRGFQRLPMLLLLGAFSPALP